MSERIRQQDAATRRVANILGDRRAYWRTESPQSVIPDRGRLQTCDVDAKARSLSTEIHVSSDAQGGLLGSTVLRHRVDSSDQSTTGAPYWTDGENHVDEASTTKPSAPCGRNDSGFSFEPGDDSSPLDRGKNCTDSRYFERVLSHDEGVSGSAVETHSADTDAANSTTTRRQSNGEGQDKRLVAIRGALQTSYGYGQTISPSQSSRRGSSGAVLETRRGEMNARIAAARAVASVRSSTK